MTKTRRMTHASHGGVDMKSNGGFQLVVRAVLAALLFSGAARAQQIDVSAGTATDQLGQRSSAVSVAPSVTFTPGDASSISLAASATRFATGVFSFGGGAALSDRAALGGSHLAFTTDVSANAARLQADLPATFAAAGVLPAIELSVSRFTFYGGVRASLGYSSSTTRAALVGPAQTQSATRDAMGSVVGLVLNAAQSADGAVRIGARQERSTIAGVPFTDRSVSLHFDGHGGALDVSGGRRMASDENVTFASAGLTLPMTSTVALQVGAGRYPSNRLMGTSGGNYLSAGLSIRFGAVAREAATRPAGISGAPPVPRGYTRLSIEARGAQQVEVAGDFDEWRSVPAVKAGDVWYADLKIPPGEYRYAFRVDGREWRVPRGATAVNDGFGGQSAWLTVREPGAQQ
jgi:hypothetical protein